MDECSPRQAMAEGTLFLGHVRLPFYPEGSGYMRIALETLETKPDTSDYYEFLYGQWKGEHWGSDSVYLQVVVFELVAPVLRAVPGLNPTGPGSFSASSVKKIVAALRSFSSEVAKADRPQQIWGGDWKWISEQLRIHSWPTAKKSINRMLKDLAEWFGEAADRDETVAVLGL